MLEPWALRHHWLKKRVAWWLYQRRDLHRAAMLHATASSEAAQFRRLGLRQPIVVLPNGVDLPTTMPPRAVNPTGRRRALFLSRIHPKKGLIELVQAWSRLRPQGWEMVIAGTDEGGHEAEVRRAVDAVGLRAEFVFPGAFSDEAKWALYRSAELFVLPTHSENFGVVVAEAMAAGLPVITTHGAPWALLEEQRCGWWIPDDAEGLQKALADALDRPPDHLAAMGSRGAAAVTECFRWDRIGSRMAQAYRWMLGDEPERPDCVVPAGAAVR